REAGKLGEAVQVLALGGDDRHGHRDDQRDRREPAEQADQEQRTADELRRGGEHGIETGGWDTQLREEFRDLLKSVQLAPTGADEDDAQRQPRERRTEEGETFGGGEEGGLCARKESHSVCSVDVDDCPTGTGSVTARRPIRLQRVTESCRERTQEGPRTGARN